jgi:hypothetical protein
VKGVVVVGVVPIDRTGRHEAFLVGRGRIGQRLDRRLAHLRIVEVQFPVLGDDVLTSIGNQEIIECAVGINAVGRNLETKPIDVARPLFAQSLLYSLKKL